MARNIGKWIGLFFLLAIPRAWAEGERLSPPPDFGKFVPHPLVLEGTEGSTTRMVALVYLDEQRVRPEMVVGGNLAINTRAHYEVTEWCSKVLTFEPNTVGCIKIGGGSGMVGPNCYAYCETHSGAFVSGSSSTSIGPLMIRNPITIKWCPGKDKEPEPKDGVTIFLHHSTEIYGEAMGSGIKNVYGFAKAKGEAKTQSKGGSGSTSIDLNAPLVGIESLSPGDHPTYTLSGLRSGQKIFITAEVWSSASTYLISSAMVHATAEITWEASSKSPMRSRIDRPRPEDQPVAKEVHIRW